MATVLIQAGHSAAFLPWMAGGGGAPGEAEWTEMLARLLAARLEEAGITTQLVGCWALDNSNPPALAHTPYDLFVALHYDAAIYGPGRNTGCLVDWSWYLTTEVEQRARAFCRLWEREYPARTGIPLHQERCNPNTSHYYAYRDLHPSTPAVLIEHGVGAPDAGQDAPVLWNEPDRIAAADAAVICAFLGEGAPPMPTPKEPSATLDAARAALLMSAVWAGHAMNPEAAIAKAWLDELHAGRYHGAPLTEEVSLGEGAIMQRFEHGVAVYLPGEPVSWRG